MAAAAIVIPTLLGGTMLEECLDAIGRQTWRDFEVVVVNNGGAGVRIEGRLGGIPLRVIVPVANIGFGAAVNMGIAATDAALVATLNDDTIPAEDWIEELVREISSDDQVGMCASRIIIYRSDRLDSAGMLICLDASSKQRGGRMPASRFPHSEEALLPSACAALYRRKMLLETGGFDEDFFLYCEDTDLGLRARWAGWQCRYAAGAQVEHRYSATAGAVSPLKAYYVERNRLWTAIKNFPAPLAVATPLFAAVRYGLQWLAGRRGQSSAARFLEAGNSVLDALAIVTRAHIDTIAELPRLIRKRAAIRATRKIGAIEFTCILYRHRIRLRDLAKA